MEIWKITGFHRVFDPGMRSVKSEQAMRLLLISVHPVNGKNAVYFLQLLHQLGEVIGIMYEEHDVTFKNPVV